MDLRRLRKSKNIRELVKEVHLSVEDLIEPVFVVESKSSSISAMEGIRRFNLDDLLKKIERSRKVGIKAFLFFGVTTKKDPLAKQAYNYRGIVQKALRKVKRYFKDTVLIADVCICGYTPYGHCGIVKKEKGYSEIMIDNAATLELLNKIALSYADCGVDFVAPSAMMDNQVKSIREALDNKGFFEVGILSYSAKYASSFYSPFRQAVGSFPRFGDRKTYQMDYHNREEALREVAKDIQEGADIVMVKPAWSYLDIIRRVKDNFSIPLAAYNVSGEYALIKNYFRDVKNKDEEMVLVEEVITAIKRAGADMIITYWAEDLAKWLSRG